MNEADAAALAAALMALDPVGFGGVCIRSQAHPLRDEWLRLLRRLLPEPYPIRRIPCNIDDGRLLGGLDLAATLQANRPVCERGVLAHCDGGVIVLAMAERVSAHTAACIAMTLDTGEIQLARDGFDECFAARFGVIALDEGAADEALCPALLDRLGVILEFEGVRATTRLVSPYDAREIDAARELLPRVTLADALLLELCDAALALGITSPRVALRAARVAQGVAALAGRGRIERADAAVAGRLVLAPRATRLPSGAEADSTEPQSNAQDEPARDDAGGHRTEERTGDGNEQRTEKPAESRTESPPEQILEASVAAIPPGLLARLTRQGTLSRAAAGSTGRSGREVQANRGRAIGVRAAIPQLGVRLNVVETLRAAAPWQRLRGRATSAATRLKIHAADLRSTRHQQRTRSLTIFVVDASGSAAANRLAEAKGAVELLLAECYIRRDRVAVIAFRNRTAEIVLQPTRSLVRAKRGLSGMVGGGGTPLADALAAAMEMGTAAQRRGETPTLVLLSDGQANVARTGTGGRALAHADAMTVSRTIRTVNLSTVFIDTAPRPSPLASALALTMNARYFPLPFVSSRVISDIVRNGAAGDRR